MDKKRPTSSKGRKEVSDKYQAMLKARRDKRQALKESKEAEFNKLMAEKRARRKKKKSDPLRFVEEVTDDEHPQPQPVDESSSESEEEAELIVRKKRRGRGRGRPPKIKTPAQTPPPSPVLPDRNKALLERIAKLEKDASESKRNQVVVNVTQPIPIPKKKPAPLAKLKRTLIG